jgi:hypothetical protein
VKLMGNSRMAEFNDNGTFCDRISVITN